MPRQLGWRDLRAGVLASAALAVATVAILIFARPGRIPGETYRVYVRAEEARNLIPGSHVWLNGQRIGAVRSIGFLSPASASTRRVVIEAEVMARHRAALRRDTRVEIRNGGTLIGAPVVYLSLGSPTSPVLADGDTVDAREQVDLETLTSRYATTAAELPAILDNVTAIGTLMQSPDGTLGAILEEQGGTDATLTQARVASIMARMQSGRGTLGRAFSGREALLGRARLAMTRADSVRSLLASPHTSLGRFRRDSSLVTAIADIRDELAIVRALLDEPRGTLGRATRDSAVAAGIGVVMDEMTLLFADVKRRPFRYLSF